MNLYRRTRCTVRHSHLLASIAICLFLSACGGGGSSPSGSPVDVNDTLVPDAGNNGVQSDDVVGGTGSTNGDGTTDTSIDTDSSSGADGSQDADNGTGLPVAGGNTMGNAVPGDLSSAMIVAEVDGPAPGTEGTLESFLVSSLRVDNSGAVTFQASIGDRDTFGVWGGMLSAPQLLLRSGMQIDDIPANIRLDSIESRNTRLSDDGSIAAIVGLTGASTVKAVVLGDTSGVRPVFRSDQALTVGEASVVFSEFDQIRLNNGVVAAVVREPAREPPVVRSPSLFTTTDTGHAFIAPGGGNFSAATILLAPLQADGCRIMLRDSNRSFASLEFDVLSDGAVAFDAKIAVEAGANPAICPDRLRTVSSSLNTSDSVVGNNFESIVIYRSGTYTRIVSAGDPVPGMQNSIFTAMSLIKVLDNGALLVAADIADTTQERSLLPSRWIFREGAVARLVALNGEQTESAITGSQYVFDLGDRGGIGGFEQLDVLAVQSDGSVLVRDEVQLAGDETITWLLSGNAHEGQPYANFATQGASPLTPVLVTGSPAPEGFADSTFWSSIGLAERLPGGGGVFSAAIIDSAPGIENPVASGLWRFDENGTISKAMEPEVTVLINEIPRTLQVPGRDWQLVGDKGIVYLEGSGFNARLIYVPFEM